MYVYDGNGDMKSKNVVKLTAGDNQITVAPGELVIAELVSSPQSATK
ncbi:MAG: hypothetical protein KAH23_07010 [Kiritimatiellae bacterium]|nr:hypothetical protein [Kiritimatiellia bacterium]